jgi:hypothetical protein
MAEKRTPGRMRLFTETGKTGLKRYGGYIDEEWLTQLRGDKAAKVYREMADNDPTVGAGLYLIDAAVRQVNWFVDPDPETDERSNLVWTAMHDMSFSWRDFIAEALTMLPYGWSWFETVYKRRRGMAEGEPGISSDYNDGKIGWRKFAIRMQESLDEWDIDDNGGIRGMWQRPAPDYKQVYIPIRKSILFRTTVRGNNPEGRSVLRNSYIPWYRKKRIEEIEAIGIERDLAGLPVAWVPPEIMRDDADDEEKAVYTEIKQIVQNIRRDEQEGLVMPLAYDADGNMVYDVTLLTTGGERQFNTLEIRRQYALEIAMVMLADILFIGHEKVGSFALAANKINLLNLSLGAVLDGVTAPFNRHAIPRLLQLNGMSTEKPPKLMHGPVATIEPREWAEAIFKLSQAGYTMSDEVTQQHMRERFGMPKLNPADMIDPQEMLKPEAGDEETGDNEEEEE